MQRLINWSNNESNSLMARLQSADKEGDNSPPEATEQEPAELIRVTAAGSAAASTRDANRRPCSLTDKE